MGRALRAPFPSSHPTDEELLAFLDGELDGRALTRIRSHLDACWPCRGRRDRFNQAISAFVDARLDDCASHEGFPPSAALKLSARLDEVDARTAATRPSFWRRMFWQARAVMAWRPTPAMVAQACVAALTITLVVISIGREPSVSAQELLARTVAAQEARLRPVPEPVLYQRLQVSRRAGAAGPRSQTQQTWEIWSDTVHRRYRERLGAFAPIARRAAPDTEACGISAAPTPTQTPAVALTQPPAGATTQTPAGATTQMSAGATAPTLIRELESILCANGLRSAQPLSARAWSEWRGRVRGASERVREENGAADDDPAALVLHTRLPGEDGPMRIREAELVVRADDWHPLAQRFTVEIDRELVTFELRELSFEVVELASVAPAFFDDRPSPAEIPATAAATTAVEAVSEADVIAAEVQAWDALHKLGALRGEPVEIVRAQTSPRVEVRGLVASPERKQAIVDAVSAIPLVTASIRTVDEALAAKPTPSTSAAAPTGGDTSTMIQTGTVPILPLIEAYLRSPREAGVTGVGGPVAGAPAAGTRPANLTDARAGSVQALATDVVSLSRDAMTDAWALERLARFAQGLGVSAVRPSSRRTLERMAAELAAATAAKLDALSQRITPIAAPLLDNAPATPLASTAPSASSASSTPPASSAALASSASSTPSAPSAPSAASAASTPSTPSTSSATLAAPASSAAAASSALSASSAPPALESRDAAGTAASAAADDVPDNVTDWPRLALRVFARAREADELTRRLFTESDAGLVELGPSVRQLIAACTAGRQGALTLSERLSSQHQ